MILGYTTNAIVEHVEKNILVNNFKKKGIYQEELSTKTIKYFKIPYNGPSTLTFLEGSNKESLPGGIGDILVSVQQNTVNPMVNGIISFYAGGHAGYIPGEFCDYDNDISELRTIETTMTTGNSSVCDVYDRNDWNLKTYYTEVIGLRVNLTEREMQEVTSSITSMLNDPYNASFFFNTTNSEYCTDLISKAYKKVGKNLNNDGFTTSVWDIIVSPDTFISYYHYIDNNGIKYVYYLG